MPDSNTGRSEIPAAALRVVRSDKLRYDEATGAPVGYRRRFTLHGQILERLDIGGCTKRS